PDREGRFERGAALAGDDETAAALVLSIDRDLDEAAPLERLEVRGQRGAVHGERRRDLAHDRRLGLIERDEQRELPMGQANRAQHIVEIARERARRALDANAETRRTRMARRIPEKFV